MPHNEISEIAFWRERLTIDPKILSTQQFFDERLPEFEKLGWIIEIDHDMNGLSPKIKVIDNIESFIKPVDDWFELDIGVQIGHARHDLAPLLAHLFKYDARWLNLQEIDKISDDEAINLSDFRLTIQCPASRIKPFARNIADLILARKPGPIKLGALEIETSCRRDKLKFR